MSRQQDEQAIALAAMFQAVTLVDQIAQRGMVPQDNFATSIYSLFAVNPPTTEAVFGNPDELTLNLSCGLKGLRDLINKKQSAQNSLPVHYVLSLIALERKLAKRPDMLKALSQKLAESSDKVRYFDPDGLGPLEGASALTHPSVIASLARLYQDTISTFSLRIQVKGDPRHLQNSENADKIRALLLAGIRAAMLWRQVGGSRWHLLSFRSRLKPALRRLSAD